MIKCEEDKANKRANRCFYQNSNIFNHIIIDSRMETMKVFNK